MNLRQGAKGEVCSLQIPGICLHLHGQDPERETTVLAHLRTLANGAGEGLKPDDKHGVHACFECHDQMDKIGVGNMDQEIIETALRRTRARQKHRGLI